MRLISPVNLTTLWSDWNQKSNKINWDNDLKLAREMNAISTWRQIFQNC